MSAPVQYNAQHGMSYSPAAAAPSTPWYGSAEAVASLLAGISQGAGAAFNRPSGSVMSSNKKEAREAKRRSKANIFNQAMRNQQDLSKLDQRNSDDRSDYRSQAMQQIARGFVSALQGST